MHHLIVTRSMARSVPKSNKDFWRIVESARNKYPLCNNCHLNYGGKMGHISRKDGLNLLRNAIGADAADKLFETVLSDAEKHLKVNLARLP